ncbi:hypothetical protein ASD74_06085 [Rhizobium sp. Root564]|nr:hypothetical protein ASD74_06085 [Rhizobium sp. Root564]
MHQTAEDDRQKVSYHAVARYVQHILLIDLPQEFLTEKAKAQALADAAGFTVAEIRGLIWTKGMAAASALGLETFGNREFSARIAQPEGVVVTVYLPRPRPFGKLRILSETELKHRTSRIARREKARLATRQSLEEVEQ